MTYYNLYPESISRLQHYYVVYKATQLFITQYWISGHTVFTTHKIQHCSKRGQQRDLIKELHSLGILRVEDLLQFFDIPHQRKFYLHHTPRVCSAAVCKITVVFHLFDCCRQLFGIIRRS